MHHNHNPHNLIPTINMKVYTFTITLAPKHTSTHTQHTHTHTHPLTLTHTHFKINKLFDKQNAARDCATNTTFFL